MNEAEINMLREALAAAVSQEQLNRNEANRLRQKLDSIRRIVSRAPRFNLNDHLSEFDAWKAWFDQLLAEAGPNINPFGVYVGSQRIDRHS